VVAQPEAVLPQFPADFPLPPGLRLIKSLSLRGNPNNIQLVGYAPLAFGDAARFMIEALPAAGYALGRGDSEGATEAESTFTGPPGPAAFASPPSWIATPSPNGSSS
jgi:hypothetical protein